MGIMWKLMTGFFLFLYARFVEPYMLFTPVYKVRFKRLPKDLSGMRIAHISDIHGRLDLSGEPVLSRIEKMNPDILVITGDFVEGEREVDKVVQGISNIAKKYPIFYVTGNNDYPEWQDKFREQMANAGAVLLHNRNVRITIRGVPLTLVGVDDPVYGKPDLEQALRGVEEQDFKILLAHSFKMLDAAADVGIDLVLAGHSHGGQILFPLFILLHRIFGNVWAGRTSGWYRKADTLCFISRGTGCSTIKIRFLSFPELPIIEFVN